MWRSRLRATFLSSRDEIDGGDEPTITLKTGYDIYRMLCGVFPCYSVILSSCIFTNSTDEFSEVAL